ncbi:MAG: type II and III secretion system protein family protein [Rhizobiaceae bacterium]
MFSINVGGALRPHTRVFFTLLFAALLVVSSTTLFVQEILAQQQFVNLGNGNVSQVTVRPGKTLTIETDREFGDIIVGNPKVADVVPLSSRSLYVQGNGVGFTNISILDADKNLLGVIDVRVKIDFVELSRSIQAAVPSARVNATSVNNRIRLSGKVKDAVDMQKVLEIAEQYAPGDSKIINSIRVKDAQQVQLQVRVLEVTRGNGRDLGVNLLGVSAGGVRFVTGESLGVGVENRALTPTFGRAQPQQNAEPFGTFIGNLLEVAGYRVDVIINALEEKGLARRLANPTLVAVSGRDASFLAGGEVPISRTVTGQNGNVATETTYREFGVRLNFTPIVLDDGLIHLDVEPEVSDINRAFSDGAGNPGFSTRRARTSVELRDGQSFAIAGLLQTVNDREIRSLPWLGQLPILGSLFRSTRFQKNETDLVILVTPKIVRPASPDEPLSSPLDQTRSSDDVELFLLGMLEVDKEMIRRFHNGEGIIGPYGHIIDLEFGDDPLIAKK